MSIALTNKVKQLEQKLAALEAAFSILAKAEPVDLQKIKDDIQGLKMRMGKKEVG